MRLTIDLRFDAPPRGSSDAEVVVTFRELVAMATRPRDLRHVLRGRRYEALRVIEDSGPMSGVQAVCLLFAAVSRSRRFEGAVGGQRQGRLTFTVRAVERFCVAAVREILQSLVAYRHARRVAVQTFDLPTLVGDVRSITYLRAEPSLRWLGEQIGGAATHTSGVINGFVDNGVDVEVFAAEQPHGTEEVPFTAVKPERLLLLVHWLTLIALTPKLVDAAAGRPVDVVYQRYALGSFAGLELARRLNCPLVLEFNGSEIWAARHWWKSPVPFERTLTALERRNLLDASLIVVTSEVLHDDLVADGIDGRKVLVNPNAVDVERLAPLRGLDPPGWRRRLNRAEAPTVGFIGTFGAWHGVEVLPLMIEAVARERSDVRWVLIGDGPLREEVAADIAMLGVQHAVELTGVVVHERALELLASCDVCVSPHVPNPDGTRFFGSPTKLFEYMGLGKAIVASNLEQIGEVLDHGRTALLCDPGDPHASAKAVLRLLGDPELSRSLGDAALEDASQRHSWRAHARRILDAIDDLAAQGCQATQCRSETRDNQ